MAAARYRVGNRLLDGTILWIVGEFEIIDPPPRLTCIWRPDGSSGTVERFKDARAFAGTLVGRSH